MKSFKISYILLCILFSTLISFNVIAVVPQAERDALVALYNSTDGPNWISSTNWLVGDPCDNDWLMIQCETNRVVGITLGTNNLSGNIPPELGGITNLRTISLQFNHLTGIIPVEISNLTNLESLDLWSNHLTGEIPTWLGGMTNLTLLDLSWNQFTGIIPVELTNLTNLWGLFLNSNQLTGGIPSEFGTLNTTLRWFYLYNNQLTGEIPTEIGNMASLERLYLYNNKLSGVIPVEFGNLTNLQYLRLDSNKFSGALPSVLSNLSNLISVNFDYNAMYSYDGFLNNFIHNICACDWRLTQTIAPLNLLVVSVSSNSISLGWNTVGYQQYGGYKIYMSDNNAGPFNEVAVVPSKTISTYTQGNLSSDQDYYFKIKSFTNPHSNNQSQVSSDESGAFPSRTDIVSGTADLWLQVSSTDLQQSLSQGDTIHYKILVGNNGPDIANGTGFTHTLPAGFTNQSWSCTVNTGTATCPALRATGNVNLILNLPVVSSLEFNFIADVETVEASNFIISATVIPPNGISDNDLTENTQAINFDIVFKNSFE